MKLTVTKYILGPALFPRVLRGEVQIVLWWAWIWYLWCSKWFYWDVLVESKWGGGSGIDRLCCETRGEAVGMKIVWGGWRTW